MNVRTSLAALILAVGTLAPGAAEVGRAQQPTAIEEMVRELRANGMPDPSGVVLFKPPPRRGPPPPEGAAPGRGGVDPAPPESCASASGDDERVTCGGAAQNETAIAHDPNSTSVLVGGANDYRVGDTHCGYYLSTDAGATWPAQGTLLPRPRDLNAAGDPALAFDGNGNVYYSCLGFNRQSGKNGIYVYKGTVGGGNVTWGGPAEVAYSNRTSIFNDKEYITVDRANNRPYVCWTRFENNRAARIVVAGSANGGTSFAGPAPTVISDAANTANQGCAPAVGSGGTVYVAWKNSNGNRILLDKGANGTGWAADRVVSAITPIPEPLPNTRFRNNSFPTLGVHPGGSPGADRLYVAWADYRTGNADVLVARSTDGGASWSAPQRLTGTGCDSCDQFFPWMSVAPDGAINIAFYSRTDTTSARMDVYVARSTDGGTSFGATRVTDVATNQDDGWAEFIGDYNGITAHNTAVHPLWTAGFRDGGTTNNQDVYTDRLPVATP